MKIHPALLALFGMFPAILSAEILLKSPGPDETITTMNPDLRAFLEKPRDERRAIFNDPAKRLELNRIRDAKPVIFRWECTGGEKGPFTVHFSEKEDFSESTPILVLPTSGSSVGEHPEILSPEARVSNFLLGRTYYWKVESPGTGGKPVVSATGRFQSDAFAPRQMSIPKVENVRDLGGRVGLDGRRVRQGMIYRSAGLNHNSPDFDWDRKKWKKERIEDFRIGDTKLTPAAVVYLNTVLGLKTDLDMRGPAEVAPMKESPAGPDVKWVHHSSSAYKAIFGFDAPGTTTGEGPEMMAKNFRIFCDRANYPIVAHCISGADRTGAMAYVLNGVLGVDAEELEKDWEITANSYFKYENFDDLAGGFAPFGKPSDPLHEKIAAYLLQIGITPEEIASYRAIMLE